MGGGGRWEVSFLILSVSLSLKIRALEERIPKATTEAGKDHIRQQIEEARKALAVIGLE